MNTLELVVPSNLPGDIAYDVRDFVKTMHGRYPNCLVVVREKPPVVEEPRAVPVAIEPGGSGSEL
jgi:hypothetical protein